jgi:hypothetical protein
MGESCFYLILLKKISLSACCDKIVIDDPRIDLEDIDGTARPIS